MKKQDDSMSEDAGRSVPGERGSRERDIRDVLNYSDNPDFVRLRHAEIAADTLRRIAQGTAYRFELGSGLFLDLVDVRTGLVPFAMGRFNVTQEQFEYVMGPTSFGYDGKDRALHPADVSFADARAFCEKLNERFADELGDKVFSLPTAGQWSTAAAGCMSGHGLSWFVGNSGLKLHAVGLLAPNRFGLYDIIGNDDEWCIIESEEGGAMLCGGSMASEDFTCNCKEQFETDAESDWGYSFRLVMNGFRRVPASE